MNIYKFGGLTLIIFMIFCRSYGQTEIARGDKLFEDFSFVKAKKCYTNVIEANQANAHVYRNLARCNLNLGDSKSAEIWYEKLMSTKDKRITDLFDYALILKSNEKYEEANKWIEKYLLLEPNDSRANMHLNDKDYHIRLRKDSAKHKITDLAINSKFTDFGPSYWKDKIVFTSSRENGRIIKDISAWNEEPFLDLFYSTPNMSNGELSIPIPFDSKINSRLHEGPATFNGNGDIIYFTRNNYTAGRLKRDEKGYANLKIYTAQFDGKDWTKEREFIHNGEAFSTGHPALNDQGDVLYFVSNMPNGLGGTDIWMCKKNDQGSWSVPENLGPEINTEGNEMFPYILNNNTLYFSSDGHVGLGGLDIFKVNLKAPIKRVKNIGAPINGPKDDFGYITKDEKTGYFSSNRIFNKKGIIDNLFYFEPASPKSIYPPCKNEPCVTLRVGGISKKATAPEIYVWNLGDGNKRTGASIDYCYQKNGKYQVSLDVIDSLTGAIRRNQASQEVIINGTKKVDAYILAPPHSVMGKPVNFEDSTIVEGATVVKYIWDFGDGFVDSVNRKVRHSYSEPGDYFVSLTTIAQPTNEKSLCETKKMVKLAIVTEEEMKKLLSPKDIFSDIPPAPYKLVGSINESGNDRPIEDAMIFKVDENDEIVDTVFTDENGNFTVEMDRNRNFKLRVEKSDYIFSEQVFTTESKTESNYTEPVAFKLTKGHAFMVEGLVLQKQNNAPIPNVVVTVLNNKNVVEQSQFTFEDGKFSLPLRPNSDYTIVLNKEKYFTKKFEISTKKRKPGVIYIEDFANILIEEIEVGKAIVLENIYYDFNKYNIRRDAKKELNILITTLKDNPNLYVELSSHTDARGNDEYNLKLSERRADAAVKYIVSKGVAANRVIAKGYGESNLVNRCKNDVECTDEEHQQNRRTEFKVLKY